MHTTQRSRLTTFWLAVFTAAWLSVATWGVLQRQAILDWVKLLNYTPPEAIAAIVRADDFTSEGEHLFYVNRPEIVSGDSFSRYCPTGGEKTVVLGCYLAGDNGIYLYDVTDERLDGVIEATAAHEMLHVGYARLSGGEKTRVNQLLQDYYDHDLKDERVKSVIESYKESEPTELLNEMHSVFGTEVPNLPAELETYYSQYFKDRSVVVATVARYEGEFSKRISQIQQYDLQLKSIKQTIDDNTAKLESMKANLEAQMRVMNSLRNSGDTSTYNAKVVTYNTGVNQYNALLSETKQLIEQYNAIVEKRNAVAIEQQELVQALSSQSLPSSE